MVYNLFDKFLLRGGEDYFFVIDGGYLIFDVDLECILELVGLVDVLVCILGVVEYGLFLNFVSKVYVVGEDGVRIIILVLE